MDFTPITDFFTNIKEKVSNPFFGTLILVSIARNWLLVYSVFNFDEKTTLNNKIKFITEYLSGQNIIIEALINIGITLSIILIGYLLVISVRTLSTFIEFKIMPWITQKVISDKVVFKEEYDNIKDDRDQYSERYEIQRQKVRELSSDFDTISENYKMQGHLVVQQTTKINELETFANEFDNELSQKKQEINTLKLEMHQLQNMHDHALGIKQQLLDSLHNTTENQKKDIEITNLELSEYRRKEVNLNSKIKRYESQLDRLSSPTPKIINFANGDSYLEFFDAENKITYFDLNNHSHTDVELVLDHMSKNSFTEDTNRDNISVALDLFSRY
ncbi:hypothetical protein [Chryseobacterium herbae]|uniref:Uncharacterized protein n=1 Tax=Chryseobacterium herbae TaxID=2976476 RepID=A0ABT2IUS5_9FLAO|nr:hypothetical protein [Chryseobacterium sp. pc1-10]MCT2562090.1 hypothetical protein [Chryseobacterium sp. pc1-10]